MKSYLDDLPVTRENIDDRPVAGDDNQLSQGHKALTRWCCPCGASVWKVYWSNYCYTTLIKCGRCGRWYEAHTG